MVWYEGAKMPRSQRFSGALGGPAGPPEVREVRFRKIWPFFLAGFLHPYSKEWAARRSTLCLMVV